MARRTAGEKRRSEEAKALPLEQPASRRRGRLSFWALATAAVVVVAGIWAFALTRGSSRAVKPPVVSATGSTPTAPATPSTASPVVSGVAATTIQAFAALPAAQQTAIMQKVVQHYNDVLNQAYSTLNPALLPQVLTGAELQVQQQQLQTLIQRNQPETANSQATILSVAAFPQLGFVSVDLQGTETGYALDPTTHTPTGPPTVTNSRGSLTIVAEDGIWKVKESIQEQPTP